MEVCHLGKHYPPLERESVRSAHVGGIESHVQTIARAQSKLGVKVSVFCLDSESKCVVRKEKDQGVDIWRFGGLFPLGKFSFSFELIRAIKQSTADVVHVHTPNPTMIVALLFSRNSKTIVVTHHSDNTGHLLLRALFWPIQNFFYRKASLIFATSTAYAKGSNFLMSHKSRVEVLPLGIDVKKLSQPSSAVSIFLRRVRFYYPFPIWLIVSRLVYYKGIDVALQAAQYIPGSVVIIGDGTLRPKLEKMKNDMNLVGKVFFLGTVLEEELHGFYKSAYALLFPSTHKSEAFGISQVEAMASGCPTINTKLPNTGVAWVSKHNQSGLTVPCGDHKALAQAANKLYRDPELRHRLSRGAVERANRLFDHRKMARKSLSSYERVLGTNQNRI